jgi:hypothetical protein
MGRLYWVHSSTFARPRGAAATIIAAVAGQALQMQTLILRHGRVRSA